MRAIVVPEAGGTEMLTYADINQPALQAGEILVNVKAVGINPMDALIRSNAQLLTAFLGEERPAILGWDVAGEVAAIGPQVTGFEIGDPVFALLPQGRGYAAYVAVRADLTVRKPTNISFEEAAAVPVAGIVAWEALVEIGQVKKGDHVLIHAGAGGVGHLAVQLAKHLGATVTATASAKNRDFLLSLGADQVIDYTSQPFEQVLTAIDFVLDTVGGDTLERSIGLVKPGGAIVTIIPPLAENVQQQARASGITLTLLIGQGSQQGMEALAALLSSGAIKAHVSAVYPFAAMADAHTAIASRRTVGKIVVTL